MTKKVSKERQLILQLEVLRLRILRLRAQWLEPGYNRAKTNQELAVTKWLHNAKLNDFEKITGHRFNRP